MSYIPASREGIFQKNCARLLSLHRSMASLFRLRQLTMTRLAGPVYDKRCDEYRDACIKSELRKASSMHNTEAAIVLNAYLISCPSTRVRDCTMPLTSGRHTYSTITLSKRKTIPTAMPPSYTGGAVALGSHTPEHLVRKQKSISSDISHSRTMLFPL